MTEGALHLAGPDDPNGVYPDAPTDDNSRIQDQHHLWNVRLLCLCFLLILTAHLAACNLLSSLYTEDGLGTATLTLVSASLLLFTQLFSMAMFPWLGYSKSVMVCSLASTSLFFAANFNAKWYTLLPGAILVGFSFAVIWSSISGFFRATGMRMAELHHTPVCQAQSDLFQRLSSCSTTAPIWGNLVTLVLMRNTHLRFLRPSLCEGGSCQEWILPDNKTLGTLVSENLIDEDTDIRTLFAVFAGFPMAASLLLAIFLRSDRTLEVSRETTEHTCLMSNVLGFFRSPTRVCNAAWSFLLGIREAFLVNDFTKSFITCPWGVNLIGDVMACYGTISAVCPFFTSLIRTCCGQLAFFTLNYLVNMVAIFVMFIWLPTTPQQLALYGILWGFASAFVHTVKTHPGIRRHAETPEPPALLQGWHLLGSCISLACSPFMCITAKLCSQLIVLNVISAIYLVAEVFCGHRESSAASSSSEVDHDNEVNNRLGEDNVEYI